MKCKICQSPARLVKTLKIRQSYTAEYFLCDTCGFLFVGSPTWLEEAYKEPINKTDTGYVLRNIYLSRKTLVLFSFLFGTKKTYLDFAGGYGMFTRLMRDYGLNFFTTDAYTKNLFAQGFEYNKQPVKAVTCFECFEHFEDPESEIQKILSISKNVFFSTLLLPTEIPPKENWEYYGLNHGQHISFYSKKTLLYISKKYNVNLYSDGENLHLFTTKSLPNWLFKCILGLTKIQLDLPMRKMLQSKTVSDSKIM